MKAVWALIVLALSASAQSIDSVVLIDNGAVRVASDSHDNLITVEATPKTLPGGIFPIFQPVWAAHRYSPTGQLQRSYVDLGQNIGATNRLAFLGVDREDNIYIGANSSTDGGAILSRPSEVPTTRPWTTELAGAKLDLQAIAFDAQNNPVLLASERNAPARNTHVIKLDRVTGRVLADGRFGTPYDEVSGLAIDGAGAVYITGWTFSANFPLTEGAFRSSAPGSCGPPDDRGRLNCNLGFVTKLDAGLQKIAYSTLLSPSAFPNSIAAAADGTVYVAGTEQTFGEGQFPTTTGAYQTSIPAGRVPQPSSPVRIGQGAAFAARASADGSSLIAATYLAGNLSEGASDVRVEANGDVVVAGVTSSTDFPATGVSRTACGPDRGPISNTFVTTLDALLSQVRSSAVVPHKTGGPVSGTLGDGSVYLASGCFGLVQQRNRGRWPALRMVRACCPRTRWRRDSF